MANIETFKGNQDVGIVKIHLEKEDLKDVISKTQIIGKVTSRAVVHKYAIKTENAPRTTANIEKIKDFLTKNQENIQVISLEEIADGLYFKHVHNEEITPEAINTTLMQNGIPMPISIKELEKLHDSIIKCLGTTGKTTLYGVNMEKVPRNHKVLLADAPYAVSPSLNTNIDKSPGINTPTFNAGTGATIAEMHHEDSSVESMNYLNEGKAKGWLFILPSHNDELITATLKTIKKERKRLSKQEERNENETKKYKLLKSFGEGCRDPLGHRNIVYTTEFLKKNNITYQMIIQSPGEAITTGIGVLHQVFNLGTNLCEAVNIGSPTWNRVSHIHTGCSCKASRDVRLQTSTTMTSSEAQVNLPDHICHHCQVNFPNKTALEDHIKITNNKQHKSWLCTYCTKPFAQERYLKTHIANVHLKVNFKACEYCGAEMPGDKIKKHKLAHKAPDGKYYAGTQCPRCDTITKTIKGFQRHVKLCYKS